MDGLRRSSIYFDSRPPSSSTPPKDQSRAWHHKRHGRPTRRDAASVLSVIVISCHSLRHARQNSIINRFLPGHRGKSPNKLRCFGFAVLTRERELAVMPNSVENTFICSSAVLRIARRGDCVG